MSAVIPSAPAIAALAPEAQYEKFIEGFLPILQGDEHEKRIPYPYLDSYGHATIGVGHLIAKHGSSRATVRAGIEAIFHYRFVRRDGVRFNDSFPVPTQPFAPGPVASELQALNFGYATPRQSIVPDGLIPGIWGMVMPADDQLKAWCFPTIDMVTDEVVRIMKMNNSFNFKARYYDRFNHFRLTEDGINALARRDILATITQLKAKAGFKNFDAWPLPAEYCLVDLAFQYGAGGTHSLGGGRFREAIGGSQWKAAAQYIPVGVAGDARTSWRISQLMSAAGNK